MKTASKAGRRAALTVILAVGVIGAIYGVAALLLPPQAFTHHDEGAKYLQVRNLRLTVSGLDWSINYPARRLDPALHWVPFHPKQHYVDSHGRIYLQWPIFLGLLTRVFWKALLFPGLYVVPLAAALGTLWAAYRLAVAVGVRRVEAWAVVPLLGLCTPLALYALLYFEHTLAALLVTLSLLAGVRALRVPRADGQPGSRGDVEANSTQSSGARPGASNSPFRGLIGGPAVSGCLLALAVYLRSELYVLALVMPAAFAVYAFRTARDGGVGGEAGMPLWALPAAWLVGFAVSLVPLWAFYALSEGNILPVHALWYFAGSDPQNGGGTPRAGLPPLRYIASAGWGTVPAFLFGPRTAPLALRLPPWVEWVGLTGAGLCALAAAGRLLPLRLRAHKWRLPAMLGGLTLLLVPSLVALFTLERYANLHGFLLAAPFVALALWPPGEQAGSDGDAAPHAHSRLRFLYSVSLLYVGLHALIISALSGLGPISLHEWGQRYLLPAYPALCVLALAAVTRLRPGLTRLGPLALAPVAVLGLLAAFAGLGLAARGYAELRLERMQVADWLAQAQALPAGEPLVTDTWWLPLNIAAGFYSRPVMLAEGDARLSQWAAEMRGRGVSRFALATAAPSVFNGAWRNSVPGLRADGVPSEARGMWVQQYSMGP